MSGFYLMHRGWMDNPVFGRDTFSRRTAWVWLIEEAAWQPRQIGYGPKAIELRRGQLSHSYRHMAKAWGWSLGAVQRYFDRLLCEKMVSVSVIHGNTVISIENYDKYQVGARIGNTETDTPPIQRRYTSDTNKKEGKSLKEEEEKPTPIGVGKKLGSRLPVGFVMPEEWIDKANTARVNAGLPIADLGTEGVKFVNYWTAKSGQAATKLDWLATWINWALNAKGNHNGRRTSGADGIAAGFAAALAERSDDRRDDFHPAQPLRLV